MNLIKDIRFPIEKELLQFEELLKSSMSSSNQLLNIALEHIKQKTGKMMRPMLVLLIARLYGEVEDRTYHAAVSLELLHTASLVHDDIVDESDKRRGQRSINSLFDNKVSVLVGDFLLATSLVEVNRTQDYTIVDVVAQLGQNLADGEILQLDNVSSTTFSEEVYYSVIYKKTAALFGACGKIAALSVGASNKDVEDATKFGEYLGICFQIRDDIFDYYDSDIGKPTGADLQEGKITLPAIHVLNTTADQYIKELGSRIKQGEASADEISKFVNIVKEKGGVDYAKKMMVIYRDRALKLIKDIPNSLIKNSLEKYLDYIVVRDM